MSLGTSTYKDDDYLPIGHHGLIGDMHTAALVGVNGTIDWYCCPNFDSPSVFASILDKDKGGYFSLHPAGDDWTSKQLYFPDTNVLITRFFTADGVGEIQDFMPIEGLGFHHRTRLIRRVMVARGTMTLVVDVQPRFNYGRDSHEVQIHPHGTLFRSRGLALALEGPIASKKTAEEKWERQGDGVSASLTLNQGQTEAFVLQGVDKDYTCSPVSLHQTTARFNSTVHYWRNWLSQSRYTGRWREQVHRSALTLKLHTYSPTGALIASPTTSLPEQLGGGRNWDYRFIWIRDAAFSLYALLRLGFKEEAHGFMGWLTKRLDNSGHTDPLRVMYRIDGSSDMEEIELDHLSGYRNSGPVRIGNGAADQRQLDIYGELIDSVYLFNKYGSPIDHDTWVKVRSAVDWLSDNWDQVDEGIWETRGGAKNFTFSRLMCWVAFDRAVRLSTFRGLPGNVVRWRKERDHIYRQIMEQGWNKERGAFVQHFGSDVVDASLLLMPLVLFTGPTDPRWLSTLKVICDEIVSDSLVYRYNVEASPDGLEGEEGTFSMCSFWYVEALTRAGRLDEARLAFEKMLTYGNHLGLYSEEIGPTGELLGNFPQAFTHLSLISAAYNLDKALG